MKKINNHLEGVLNLSSSELKGETRIVLPYLTRIEIIDSKGRAYVNTKVEDLKISIQDENRTLKIFLK